MALPVTFATLPTGNNLAALLDQDFAAVASMGTTTCTATGTNNIALSVQPNQPNPTAYSVGDRFNFIAPATNSGPVTIAVGGLAPIPVHSAGQALAPGAIVAGTIAEVVVGSGGAAFDIAPGVSATASSTGDTLAYATKFGAVFDGNSHPLSNYYTTLAAAQAAYPKATSLTNEIDGIAVQAALDSCAARGGSANQWSFGGTVILPFGQGLMNTPLTISVPCVSLRSQGHGFYMRPNVSRFVASAPTKLVWTGPAIATGNACLYMLTISVTDGGRTLAACNVEGVMFDCGQVTGVGGILIKSLRYSRIDVGIKEARGVPYAANLTAGSQNITVPSTTNIHQGEAITSASLTPGAYVMSIVNSTTIQASAQASATSSETSVIGGECIRVDVASGITDSNDTQLNEFWIQTTQEQVASAYVAGPNVMIGGSSNPGSGAGGTHYGNSSLNTFHMIYNNVFHGTGVAINNSDHNFFDYVACNQLGGDGISLVSNGSLDPHNGGARDNRYEYISGQLYFMGTDTGGFTSASTFSQIRLLDTSNGGVITHLGTAVTLSVDPDISHTLRYPYNSNIPVIPYPADSTVIGGNPRGAFAVDLQTASPRSAATQVASGQGSNIAGGINNTASGQQSAVGGGNGNIASALQSCIPGGVLNAASQNFAVAMGQGAAADLYGMLAFASSRVASGRQSQYGIQILRATSAANTTPVRLTADGAAAGAVNTVNITSAVAQANNIRVQLIAMDTTTPSNLYSWTQYGLLARTAATPGTTVYTAGTPTILASGTTAGIAITEAADTTNGAYSLTFTPPTGNVALWRVVATVQFTRIDGA